MVIDLRKCIGCNACAIVCKQNNNVPLNSWRRVLESKISEPPERLRICIPVSCMHCGQPSCKEVCPTGATYSRSDGIINIKNELCIGCGYCIVACPYHARTIVFQNKSDFEVKTVEQYLDVDKINADRIGICTKCNFCSERVDKGLAKGQRPGLDPEATPMCVISCSAGALHFGDMDNPESKVSELIRDNETVRLQDGLGTYPSVYYILE